MGWGGRGSSGDGETSAGAERRQSKHRRLARAGLEVRSLRNREPQGGTQASDLGAPKTPSPFMEAVNIWGDSKCSDGKVQEAVEHRGPAPKRAAWPSIVVSFDASIAGIDFGPSASCPQPVTCSLSPSILSQAGFWVPRCLLDHAAVVGSYQPLINNAPGIYMCWESRCISPQSFRQEPPFLISTPPEYLVLHMSDETKKS